MLDLEQSLPQSVTARESWERNRRVMNWQNFSDRPPQSQSPAPQPAPQPQPEPPEEGDSE